MAASSPARADAPGQAPTSPPSAAEHVRRAEAARRAGRKADALEAYRAAWALEKRPEIAGELGEIEIALGKYRDAAEHLNASLQDVQALTADQRSRYRKAQEIARKKVAVLMVSVNPPDATVLVDGEVLNGPRPSPTTYMTFVEPGEHVLRARFPGRNDAVVRVEPHPGTPTTVSLIVRPEPPKRLPAVAPRPPPPPAPEPVSHPLRPFGYIGLAAAGGGALLGGALVIGAAVVDGDVQDRAAAVRRTTAPCRGNALPKRCTELAGLVDTRDRMASTASVALVTSGIVGAVATVILLKTPSDDSKDRGVRVSVSAMGPLVGIGVAGDW